MYKQILIFLAPLINIYFIFILFCCFVRLVDWLILTRLFCLYSVLYSSSTQKNAAISPIQNINRAFPRGTVNRSTFHSGQTRERWPPFVVPMQTQDTSNMNRQSFFSKLSSKFSKR